MINLFRKQRGAVTVFLVIILVPTITICSLFVDASRMELAKPVVKSAGNLALNTMLTEYDEKLNEIYGLLGSCQNTEELKETVKQYFLDALKSQGIDNAETEGVLSRVEQMFEQDSEVADLLNIEGTDVNISPVKDGNLSNPSLVKQQIVEFMKYRAPIDLVSGLLDTIKKVVQSSKTAKQETKVTEEKQDYYEAENELLEILKELYDELYNFRKLNLTKEYINKQVLPDINSNFKENYRKIHKKIVFDLFNTEGLSLFSPANIKYKISEFTNNDYQNDVKYDAKNKATVSDVQKRADSFEDSISTYLDKKNSMKNTIWNYYAFDGGVYKTQYWAQSVILIQNNISKYDDYINAAKELGRQYLLFNNACQNTTQSEKITISHDMNIEEYLGNGNFVGDKTIAFSINGNASGSLAYTYKQLIKDFLPTGFYGNIAQRLKEISTAVINGKSSLEIGTKGTNGSVGTRNTTEVNQKIYEVCSLYKQYYNKFQKADNYLKNAQKCMKKIGDENSGLIKAVNNAFDEWEKQSKKLDKTDSQIKEENNKDLQEEKKLIDETLTNSNIKELSNRIDNIKELIKTVYDNINSTKYNGTKLSEIENFQTAKSKSGISEKKITTKYDELMNYASSSFKFTTGTKNVNITNSNHPDLDGVNEPQLYKWMKNKFKKTSVKKDEDEAEDEYKKYKKDSEKATYDDEEVGTTSNEIKKQSNLPSGGKCADKNEKTAKISKVTSVISNMFSEDILNSLANIGKSFRDDLYTTDYVMNMFSYDTYVNEGKTRYKEDTNSTLSTKDFEENENKTFKYNKTLTNQPINKDNNFAYLGEVEYILYGNLNVINKANAYGRIFLLRYAFNIAPVFQKFWSGTPDALKVESTAAGISLATYGVIPKNLIKLAICLMLNVLESTSDLKTLRSGKGVRLIKNASQVSVGFPATLSNIEDNDSNAFKPKYSDYLSLFLFTKLASTEEIDVYKRIADVVQVNMNHLSKNETSTYLLSKAVVYYKISADISIKPLLLALDINQGENTYHLNTLCNYTFKSIAGY